MAEERMKRMGFEVVRYGIRTQDVAPPQVRLSSNSIRLNPAAASKLEFPKYAQIWFRLQPCDVAIRPCCQDEPSARQVRPNFGAVSDSCDRQRRVICCKDLFQRLVNVSAVDKKTFSLSAVNGIGIFRVRGDENAPFEFNGGNGEMAFELIKKKLGGNMISAEPRISIGRTRNTGWITPAALTLINDPKYVNILFDKERCLVALKPSNGDDLDAYQVCGQNGRSRNSCRTFRFKPVARQLEISPGEPFVAEPYVEDGNIVFSIRPLISS